MLIASNSGGRGVYFRCGGKGVRPVGEGWGGEGGYSVPPARSGRKAIHTLVSPHYGAIPPSASTQAQAWQAADIIRHTGPKYGLINP